MKIGCLFYGVRGKNRAMMRIQQISEHPYREVINKRLHAIEFSKLHGIKATLDAFNISRSTLFNWKKKLKQSSGLLPSLAPISRAPRKRRQRVVNQFIEQFIIDYRTLHPGVGKETIKPALDCFCEKRKLKTISESTIGRIIKALKKQHRLLDMRQTLHLNAGSGKLVCRQKKLTKKLRRKDYMPKNPGDLVQIDSITFFADGVKRYLISAIDLVTGFAFAYGYNRLNSNNAKDFFHKFQTVAPFQVKHIQTDNGSEFDKNFRKAIRASPIVHFHSYPRKPQSNAYVERFNRTVQEQHTQWHEDDIFSDNMNIFNGELMEYLLWFNIEKPKRSTDKKSPLQYFVNMTKLNKSQSNMLWTSTLD